MIKKLNIGKFDKERTNKRLDSYGKVAAMVAASFIIIHFLVDYKNIEIGTFKYYLSLLKNLSIYATVILTILEAYTEHTERYYKIFSAILIVSLLVLIFFLL